LRYLIWLETSMAARRLLAVCAATAGRTDALFAYNQQASRLKRNTPPQFASVAPVGPPCDSQYGR
jgi:hypothetical protein